MNQNLYAILAATFLRYPDKRALDCDTPLTFAELHQKCAQFALALHSLGIGKGDRIAVQLDKSVEYILLYLACLRIGAVFVPFNPAYQRTEMDYFLHNLEPKLLFSKSDNLPWITPLAASAKVETIQTINADGSGTFVALCDKSSAELPIAHCDTDDLAAIIYTSGTTGRSKGAMLTHGNLSSNALTLIEQWGFSSSDTLVHALPLFHVHGLFVALHCALGSAATTVFLPKFEPSELLSHLPNATVFMGVPTFYTRLLATKGFTKELTGAIRLFISGSAPLLAETFSEFEDRTGKKILERYGMSEGGMIASNPLIGARKPETVGPALAQVSIRIAGPDNLPVGSGAIGEVQIKGPNVFAGYFRMPDKTNEEFTADRYFRTGDLGMLDADGYLCLIGRSKDLIISGGLNIYPSEIESYLNGLDNVLESAVVGIPHPDFGEVPVAFVVLKRPELTLDEKAILAQLKQTIAAFKVPKRLFCISQLPRNAMAKVQKAELRKTYANLFSLNA